MRKKRLFTLFVMAALPMALRAELRELSFMTAMPAKTPLVIDGALSEDAWRSGVANKNYYKYIDPKGTRHTDFDTRCTILFDEKGLYTGVVNYQSDTANLRRQSVRNNDIDMWLDDCAELYYDPVANGVSYYKFVVNANGKNDSSWRMDAANYHKDWRAKGVVSAAKVFDDRWELEIFIPWEAFGVKSTPDAGSFWLFNHSRFTWRPRRSLCSSAPCASGSSPDRFGFLYFSDGKAPSPEKIISLLEKRLQSDWGISLGSATYLHTVEGTRKINETLQQLMERTAAETKAYDAECHSNLIAVVTSDKKVAPLKLRLAGTYDLKEPKEYDGYNGWYRHNVDMKMASKHIAWGEKITDKPRVLFITGVGGEMRDAVEFASRFGCDVDVMSGRFDHSGIYEDSLKGGTYLDKCRQIETLLAKNPDVVVCYNRVIWQRLPVKYKLEIARRVRDDGVGLVLSGWSASAFNRTYKGVERDDDLRDYLAAAVPFAGMEGFGTYNPVVGLSPDQALLTCLKIGKGKVVYDEALRRDWKLSDPDWLYRWAYLFETRYARVFEVIRAVQKRAPRSRFIVEEPLAGRISVDGDRRFYPVAVRVDSDGRPFSAALKVRMRDSSNALVREKIYDLHKGDNCIAWPLEDLPGGDYALDMIAFVGGKADAVSTRLLTVASRAGDFAIARAFTNIADRVVKSPVSVTASWTKQLREPVVSRMSLRTLPHGDLVWSREETIKAKRLTTSSVKLAPGMMPTLAGTLTAELLTTNGVKIASEKRTYFFPNHDFEKYTRIMWDGLDCCGSFMIPLFARSVTDDFGYNAFLGDSRFTSNLYNGRPVPYIARVCLQRAENGGVCFTSARSVFGTTKEVKDDFQVFEGKKAKEINPYDPRFEKLLDKYFDKKAKAVSPYGVCVWNLGDECNYTYDCGVGPQDKEPFAKFLKEKYGTIEKFNAVHATNVADFASAPHVDANAAIRIGNAPMYYDHIQYIDRMYSDTFKTLSKIIKRHDPKARVGAEGSMPGNLEQTIDGLEFWGPYRNMILDELLRCIGFDKVRGTWWGGYFNNLRDGFPLQQWEFILTGTVNADQWFALNPGYSLGAYGGDLKFAPYVKKMLPHLRTLRYGLAQSLIETPFRNDGFAMWYSYASDHASRLSDRYTSPNDSLGALIRFCYRKGYNVDMVTGRTASKLAARKVLFLPGTSVLSDSEVAAIEAWMKKGGRLYADSEPGLLDEFFVARKEPPFKGRWKRFSWSEYSDDENLQKLLAENGISNKESITGIDPAQVIFRVREKGDMRLVGFKCVKKSLGAAVTIDLGEPGWVYEFDSGKCLGRMSRISIPSLDVPFKCYSVFKSKQKSPDPKNLVPGRVYRMSAYDASGREIVYRTKVFTAKKGVDHVKNFFIPLDEPDGVTYRVRDVATGLENKKENPSPEAVSWRPQEKWFGFNLLGMFCKTKMKNGDKRIFGRFPEDHFIWLQEWGFNFVRLPLDYRFFVEEGDWMKIKESQLKKLDQAVQYGKKHNIHVQINFHRAPGYCCNPPVETQSLFKDKEPLTAFTNLWSTLAKRYKGIPNEELSFDLVNEPAPVSPYDVTPSNYAVVARAALASIRAVDKNRFVMSDGWEWGNKPVMELHPFDHASGESIHCYSPHSVTHYKVFNKKSPDECPPWPPAGYTNGLEWLEKNYVSVWQKAIDDGTFLFVGEFGCYQPTVPHATFLAWLEDALKMCDNHGWGWALWNVDGKFGIMDNGRTDCRMEDFRGHKLDRKALNLLIKYARKRK